MSKKLLHNYSFVAATKTITLEGIYGRERLLMISNMVSNQIIYVFNQQALGLDSYSINTVAETTTLVLTFDTTSMSDTDTLQVFIEADANTFIPDETYTDPVSKFRVSTPANLIDTDFEYGLQSTKWETLELVNNIPTFFSRNGDADLPITSMRTVTDSSQIVVETGDPHGLVQGNPIIVQGASLNTANGAFVVTKIIDDSTFEYASKSVAITTQSIFDDYTQIFLGSVYQGSEFKLSNLNGITTNGGTPSTLTVQTQFPLGFKAETSFFLSNSVGQKIVNFDSTLATFLNFSNIGNSVVTNADQGLTDDWAIGAVYTANYRPLNDRTKWFRAGTTDISVNVAAGVETITFNTGPHGFNDNDRVCYMVGSGNAAIGGLTDMRAYWVRVVNANTFYLVTASGGTAAVNLTNAGTTNGLTRSCFTRAYTPAQVYIGAADEKIRFTEVIPGLTTNTTMIVAAGGTLAVGSLSGTTATTALDSYTQTSAQTVFAKAIDNAFSPGQTTCQFATTPNGATINQALTTTTGAVVLMEDAPLANTIYFPSHGITTNDVVFFNSSSTTVPIARAQYYAVSPVTGDHLRFRTFNAVADLNLTTPGLNTATIEISGFTYVNGADVVYSANHGLSNGDTVVYTNQGGVTIGALTNGLTYYVSQATGNTLQLATTASGLETPNQTIVNLTTGTAAIGFMSTDYRTINKTAHGFITGDRIQYTSSTPLGGLRNGGFYYIRLINANAFFIHRTANGAVTNDANDRIQMATPLGGSSRFRKTSIIDLTSAGTGSQRLTASIDGASDGVYTITNVVDDTTFELGASSEIPTRTIQFDPASSVSIETDAIRIPDHYFRSGYLITLTSVGTPPTGLTSGNEYYVIRQSRNWIKLANDLTDAENGVAIPLTGKGVGLCTLATPNIIGEVLGGGTVSTNVESDIYEGTGTAFSSFFKTGDNIAIYKPETYTTLAITAINTTLNQWDTASNHAWANGDMIILNADIAPTGSTAGYFYYIRVVDANTVQLHPTNADAVANTNIVSISDVGTAVSMSRLNSIGDSITNRVVGALSPTKLQVETASAEQLSGLEYSVGTSLLIRADGFAIHRPYDGGVELIPSKNPDSQMIRQTRKYFRYQSGKGIQVSFAINFSPTTQIERIEYTGTSAATIHTKFPHRLSVGLNVTIDGAPDVDGVDYYNGSWPVTSIQDDYSFNITLTTFPLVGGSTGSFAEFYVNSWNNSHLRCGLYDDQNGMYFEYDGQNLSVCRRSSTKQISGTVQIAFASGQVNGTNTKFTSQLNVGDYIVIRGQSYLISKIAGDTVLYIAPSYRGRTASNVIVTKTEVEKVLQRDWNGDKCDGTGKTGYVLDIHKIQMAYMDYSWYGAGKVRFGFKDQNGNVKYIHQFVHNNKKTEAYLRSGNLPARYDIQNVGHPSYVPALAHWGTSVIMDGEFTDDKAYVFNASSNDIQVTGNNTLTVTGRVAYRNNIYYGLLNNQLRQMNYALVIDQNASYNQIPQGAIITGAGLQANTQVSVPRDNQFARTPYWPSVNSAQGFDFGTLDIRNLLMVDRQPTVIAGATSAYTVTLSSGTVPKVYDIPLISVRLAPSVDTNTIGALGEREIINRMQLLLQSVQILSTHSCEVYLRLNGAIDNINWNRVTNPSLSQLVYHNPQDAITGGTNIYSFRAAGGSGTTNRAQVATTEDLAAVATLGNSIMGGDNAYPDGPDVLTVVVRLGEDPSTVSTANPFTISGRISWSESQA